MTEELINEILASVGLELLDDDTREDNIVRETKVSQK